jgi:membrane-bound lytic murein transglycosylase D
MFGDWQLALAAYNWGQGSVQRAVDRNARAGLPTGYEQLRMPAETRNYLPKLQAIKNLVARPDTFGIVLPALENHPYFLAVPIEHDIDVDLAARLAGLSVDDFRQLNPQMNKPVILAAGTPQVLLPYDAANVFVRALARHKGMMASWTAWVAPRTMRTAEVARIVGMSEAQLREVNRIPPRMLVKTGSTLLVPRSGARNQDVAEHIADTAMLALAPEPAALRKLSFKAGKKGTTVQAVARQYRTSPVQVAIWNGVTAESTFKPGQTVVVMVPARASVARGTGQRTVKVAASGSSSRKQ